MDKVTNNQLKFQKKNHAMKSKIQIIKNQESGLQKTKKPLKNIWTIIYKNHLSLVTQECS